MPETAPSSGRDQRVQAICLMCAASALFACTDATAKWLGQQSVHPLMITWARYASSMLVIAIVVNPFRNPAVLRSNRLGLQLLRSVLLLLCTLLNFLAIPYLQLTLTTSIIFAMPLMVALLAGPFLGEWVGARRFAVILVGFGGILVATRPWSGNIHPAAILSLLSVVCYAFYVLVTRQLAAHDRPATTTFYTGVAGVLLTTPMLPFVWTVPSGVVAIAVMLALGLVATAGHWLLVLAHARAPASALSPFVYTQIVWAAVAGFVAFGDVPDGWTALGAAIVIASGLYLLWWERQGRGRPAS